MSWNRQIFNGILTQSPSESEFPRHLGDESPIIAILGPTGSGKSSFIKQLVDDKSLVPVGHGLTPITTSFEEYLVEIGDKTVTLLDTPGMDSTDSLFEQLANWTSETHGLRPLDGAILFQPVTTNRLTYPLDSQSSLMYGLDKILGCMRGEKSPYYRVVLATTMWNEEYDENGVPTEEHQKEIDRAKGLQLDHWNILTAKGAAVHRYDNTPECAKRFIQSILTAKAPDISDVKLRISIRNRMIIAIIGEAGAGKSAFIGSLVKNFSGIGTHTEDVTPYEVELDNESVILLDTPGISNNTGPHKVSKMISKWLGAQAKQARKSRIDLDGIVFLRNITDDASSRGINHSSLIQAFHRLFGGSKNSQGERGQHAYRRVVLATTMWDELQHEDEGRRREARIRLENRRRPAGAAMIRFDRTAECARKILRVIVDERKAGDGSFQYRNLMRTLADITAEMRSREDRIIAELRALQQEQRRLNGVAAPEPQDGAPNGD